MLNIKVTSPNELTVTWSKDGNRDFQNRFQVCWEKDGEMVRQCSSVTSSEPRISRSISGLKAATKYIISVARYSKDGKTLGKKSQDVAITRSG